MAAFRPNALAWMSVLAPATPVHRVMSLPDEPVTTRCNWQPPHEGQLLKADKAIKVSRHWCTGCWGTP